MTVDDLSAYLACDLSGKTDKTFQLRTTLQPRIGVQLVKLIPLADGLVLGNALIQSKKDANFVIINDPWDEIERREEARQPWLSISSPSKSQPDQLVYSIRDSLSKDSKLSGGKGSSLSVLSQLSHQLKLDKSIAVSSCPMFQVPQGVIVNTNAYAHLLAGSQELTDAIDGLQTCAW